MSISTAIAGLKGITACWELQELAGLEAKQAIGAKANPGTYEGTFSLGLAGPVAGTTSVGFDGATAQVKVPFNITLQPTKWTVGAFFYAEGLNVFSGILCSNNFATKVGYEIGLGLLTGASKILEAGTFPGAWRILPAGQPTVKTWYFVAASYSGTELIMYLCAENTKFVQVGSKTYVNNNAEYDEAPLFIGRSHALIHEPFWNGRIAFPFVSNEVNSKAELATVASAIAAPETAAEPYAVHLGHRDSHIRIGPSL